MNTQKQKTAKFILLTLVSWIVIAVLAISGQSFAAFSALERQQGGTGTSTYPGNGDVLMGDAIGEYGPARLLAGTNISIATTTHGATGRASITISLSGSIAPYPFVVQTLGGTEHSASSSRPFYFGIGLYAASSTVGTLTAGSMTATNTATFNLGLISQASSTFTGLSIFAGGINSSSTATTTFANGISLDGGCFRKAGACLTDISSSLTGILEEAGGVVSTVTIGTGLDYTGTTLSLITPVTAANGGTGQTSYTTGDILYASGATTLSKLTVGASSTILTVSSGLPAWTISPAFQKTTVYDILSVGNNGTSTIRGNGASSTISGLLNVGDGGGQATSTFNTGIKIKQGCYETATSSCLTNTASFTFRIASSTMSTSSRATQFRVPVDFDITKVSCVTYGASAAIQLDERAPTTPQTAGTNVLSAALTCTTSGASTQTFTNRFMVQDSFVNLQITDAQPTAARPTMLEVHIFGEKIQ